MRRRLLALVTSVVALATSGVVAASAASAAADTSTPLPITSYADMLVDEAHGRVFLTPGASGSAVTVTDLTGANATTVSDPAGPSGLALSSDGATVYVANATGDSVTAIDASSLAVSTPYSGLDCPRHLAVAAGKLWYSHGCASGAATVGSIDLTSGTVTANAVGASWPDPPYVAVGGGTLAVGQAGGSPSTVATYDVSTGSATARSSVSDVNVCSGLSSIAVTPSGGDVAVACSAPDHVSLLSSGNLAASLDSTRTYGGANGVPAAAAVSADGGFVAAGFTQTSSNNVDVYPVGNPAAPRAQYSLNPSGAGVLAGDGLRFGAGTGDLYVVVPTNAAQTAFALAVLHGPTLYGATAAVTAPATAPRAQPLTVTGHLTSTAAPISGAQTLHVTRTDLSGTAALADVVAADGGGAFSFGDTPTVGGPVIYTVTWDGDAVHRQVSGSATVQVSRLTSKVTISTNAARYRYHARAYVSAHLGTTYNGRTLAIYATPYRGKRTLLRATAVNSRGYLFASFIVSRRTTFTVVFPGDYRYAAASASRTVGVRARIAEQLENYYATSHGYRLYHKAQNPVTAVQLFPIQWGVCLYFRAQRYFAGGWHTVALSSCYRTDPAGQQAAALYPEHVVGSPYRVRAEWHGNTVALANVGPWVHLKFTR